MNRFVIPQFIEVEDKIFGPVTTRQFVILLAAGLFLFIAFKLADTALFIFLLAVVGGFALVLAFVKINGQSFHFFILNIIQTLRRPSLRIWNKAYTNKELNELRQSVKVEVAEQAVLVPRLSYNRIRDLSLVVNTGGYYKND
ncbi:MAG: PrgI family protein [Candidatus Magasanikbacteria bacterium]